MTTHDRQGPCTYCPTQFNAFYSIFFQAFKALIYNLATYRTTKNSHWCVGDNEKPNAVAVNF